MFTHFFRIRPEQAIRGDVARMVAVAAQHFEVVAGFAAEDFAAIVAVVADVVEFDAALIAVFAFALPPCPQQDRPPDGGGDGYPRVQWRRPVHGSNRNQLRRCRRGRHAAAFPAWDDDGPLPHHERSDRCYRGGAHEPGAVA